MIMRFRVLPATDTGEWIIFDTVAGEARGLYGPDQWASAALVACRLNAVYDWTQGKPAGHVIHEIIWTTGARAGWLSWRGTWIHPTMGEIEAYVPGLVAYTVMHSEVTA